MEDEANTRDHVGSLERGLAVMEILARHPAGMTLTEMAEEAGLTRAGARRFLLTLVATGYATQSGRLFSLSPRLLTVARTWLGGASLWTFAAPIMREVAGRFDEACNAAVLSGEDVVYVARIPGRRILSVALDVGTRLPAYCTSMGRVLLAGLAAEEQKSFLAEAKIERRTQKTITSRAALSKAIEKAKSDGFAIVDEELELGLRSIAVPINDRAARTVAAINVSTQSVRFSVEAMEREILPVLLKAKQQVEEFFFV
ncbi:IclR family transcriptional regulator [Mesorhizobium sp. M1C.F.Ca.ET.193.01.1.1]|uniref:IclR family transcriptional regulator domain-containing protein n=1 Tax=unclassified Mesorhizobium TaxID=325217 RepID=UPI000FD485E6|nr:MULTISPECIES: IclR family transcriptional regulator C-terminal domain-containing protein [unclassified Mesorhizobium]TGS98952.1 IclR family transcriptional regulator [bacterium M00.F.Ca.ET.177.01.1.1]RWA77187.1 MAG: IclR family transcriptional regulator [Mesorhizobium sp.]RWC01183.1 MAG: IclR family transcriptional regulator [Mesorhizobium sp.]RWG84819.1 MAG: IclR family transcriptional regulator [Mesorhizobium sp.]RWG90190.1 MAG: IclR family transcriptional regulator [Mesorhizobium sp.]